MIRGRGTGVPLSLPVRFEEMLSVEKVIAEIDAGAQQEIWCNMHGR